jgi:hypothetical protein
LNYRIHTDAMNAEFLHMGMAQSDRLRRLNGTAIRQMRILTRVDALRSIGQLEA